MKYSKLFSLICAITLLIPAFLQAQTTTKPGVPLDPTSGKIEYTEVIELGGLPQSELFNRAESWMKDFYPNANSVIQSKDETTGKINGKHAFTVFMTDKKGKQFNAGTVNYTIDLEFKNGKYRYQIHKIWWKNDGKKPIEGWLDENDPNKERNFSYLSQTHDFFMDLTNKLKESMAAVPETGGDDW